MKSIAEIYPSHAKALSTADLLPKKIPTLLEQLKQNDKDKLAKEMTDENKKIDSRYVFFCVGYSRAWDNPVHKTISRV